MAYQLVVSGNRILGHGKDCFLSMGGTVTCENTGSVYQNATIVTHEGEIPADIDRVGYEYHSGVFVPCAPFGTGNGNVAVFCGDDCKALKDSGVPFNQICQIEHQTYIGNGGINIGQNLYGAKLQFNGVPQVVFVNGSDSYHSNAIITQAGITSWYAGTQRFSTVYCNGTEISWTTGSTPAQLMNGSGTTYDVTAITTRA